MFRVFSLFTISEISKWCNLVWIFSNSQGNFLVSFLCQFFHFHFPYSLFLEFLSGECWPSWTNPLMFLSFLSYWPSLSFCSSFWKMFPLHLPDLLFLGLLFLISKNSSFLFLDRSWIKTSCFWWMGAALPLISLRILNLCFLCICEALFCSPALFVFPPKSFPMLEWFGFLSSQRLSSRIRWSRMSIHIEDPKIWFAGLLWGGWSGLVSWWISLMETEWWARLFRVGPQMAFSSGLFSAATQFPQAEPLHSSCGGWCLAASRGRGWVQNRHHSVIISADFRFPPGISPKLPPALRCILWPCSESFWFNTSREKLPALCEQAPRKGRGRAVWLRGQGV